MKPDLKSPYFFLSILLIIAFFMQAFFFGDVVREQVQVGNGSSMPVLFSICLGFISIGLAGLCYFKTTSKKQTLNNQLLAFILVPLVLLPIIVFVVAMVVLLPLYGLVSI